MRLHFSPGLKPGAIMWTVPAGTFRFPSLPMIGFSHFWNGAPRFWGRIKSSQWHGRVAIQPQNALDLIFWWRKPICITFVRISVIFQHSWFSDLESRGRPDLRRSSFLQRVLPNREFRSSRILFGVSEFETGVPTGRDENFEFSRKLSRRDWTKERI